MPKAPKVPAAPDPKVTAQAQTQSNLATLHATQAAQNIGQNNQYGSLGYQITGSDPEGNPLYTATSTLSPDQQQILDNLENSQKGLGGTGFNLVNDVSGLYGEAPDFSEQAGTQTKINMDRHLAYTDPFRQQQTEQLDNQLRNQGLFPGSKAYDRAMLKLRDDQSQSIQNFLNTSQPIAFNQAVQQYNQPLETIGKIFGLTQPANLQQSFVGTPKPTMGSTDVAGITASAFDSSMKNYQAQLAQHNAMMNGIFGIGSAGLMMI